MFGSQVGVQVSAGAGQGLGLSPSRIWGAKRLGAGQTPVRALCFFELRALFISLMTAFYFDMSYGQPSDTYTGQD